MRVEALRPEVHPVGGVDQLRRDPQPFPARDRMPALEEFRSERWNRDQLRSNVGTSNSRRVANALRIGIGIKGASEHEEVGLPSSSCSCPVIVTFSGFPSRWRQRPFPSLSQDASLNPHMLLFLFQLAVTQVAPPRLEASLSIDGVLDEAVWSRAARLGSFTQYSPVDGRPAAQPTEVLVWYSATALYFGVRATAEPGTVRAHLTDRDRGILPDDYVEIQLGTFNDGRSAFVFAVNPLGVQADGALVEGNQTRRSATEGDRTGGREQPDLSPDYTFDSRGRVTDGGYEVEIRIPFRSLRYQNAKTQNWTLQIIRKSAQSGREDTWTPARRDAASFLTQHGKLVGLTGLRRGLVLEMNPIVTSSINGAPSAPGWQYDGGKPEVGGNVKWGVSTNLTLNGTVNPDFSQVESDAGQITPDPRRALFFAEKRPFFLDGLEYFSTPAR